MTAEQMAEIARQAVKHRNLSNRFWISAMPNGGVLIRNKATDRETIISVLEIEKNAPSVHAMTHLLTARLEMVASDV